MAVAVPATVLHDPICDLWRPPMRSCAAILALILLPLTALAHPGWGLQVDTAENVYFTDLEAVYLADDQGAVRRVAVDVHAHALYLDEEERLVGDHSWVDDAGKFHQTWWRIERDGRRVEISEYEAAAVAGMGGPGGGRLMLDSNVHEGRAVVVRVSEDGGREVIGGGDIGSVDGPLDEARFGVFGASIADGRGGLVVTSGSQLRAIDARGKVSTLIGESDGHPLVPDESSGLLGLSLAFNGDVFVADLKGRQLLRRDRDTGAIAKVLGASFAWHIAGVDVGGTYIYLLEYSRLPWSDEVRVRRIDTNGNIDFVGHNQHP